MPTNKSTNVRPNPLWARYGFRLLTTLSPPLAARWAKALFLRTPPALAVKTRAAAIFAQATPWAARHQSQKLQAWRWGQGPAVLLVHGWGGRATQLADFVAPLQARGISVVAYDAAGHGASPGGSNSLPDLARTIVSISEQVGPLQGIIAHSLGGAATALAVAQGLRVPRIAYLAPPADASAWLNRFGEFFGLTPAVVDQTRLQIEKQVQAAFKDLNIQQVQGRHPVAARVYHDQTDNEVRWEEGALFARTLDAPLITTHGLGHRRILSDPEVIRSVVEFIEAGKPHACVTCGTLVGPKAVDICETCQFHQAFFQRKTHFLASAAA